MLIHRIRGGVTEGFDELENDVNRMLWSSPSSGLSSVKSFKGDFGQTC